jgi:retinol dehydrogenase 12
MVFGFGKSVSFDASKDIPALDGKVILVTGGNIGLGKQAVLEYSRHGPAQIWLAARNLDKAQAALNEIKQQVADAPIRLLELDLGSFESVKKAAQTFLAESDRLDILMLNAGIMGASAALTTDGYELQFGTNHMGHALLTKLLLPVLDRTAKADGADVRIVSLSSHVHMWLPKGGFQFDTLKTTAESMGGYPRYYQSKLANVLWARQLAKQHPQFTVASIHPGIVKTNLMANSTGSAVVRAIGAGISSLFFASVETGVKNQLWASVAKDVKSGEYYEPVGIPGLASADGKNDDLAKQLWDWTEKELEGHGA